MKTRNHYQFWHGPLNYDVYVFFEIHEHKDGDVELPIKCKVDSSMVVGHITCIFQSSVFDTSNPDEMMTVIEWAEIESEKNKFY